LQRAADDGGAKWASISRRWPSAGCGRATSFLRSPERNVAFGAKNIGVEIGNPLPTVRRDVTPATCSTMLSPLGVEVSTRKVK